MGECQGPWSAVGTAAVLHGYMHTWACTRGGHKHMCMHMAHVSKGYDPNARPNPCPNPNTKRLSTSCDLNPNPHTHPKPYTQP